MTTGIFADGKLWQRPYSVASAPRVAGIEGYEFYVRVVPLIRFTTLLWRLPVGHRMRMIGPKGKFLLEPDDHRTHLFISTGTGIAPFMSMIRETLAEGRPRKTVVLHGCSYVEELGYREELEELAARRDLPGHLRADHQPPRRPAQRRLDRADRPRRARRPRGLPRPPPAARSTVVYICGNPDMILNAESVLMDSGFPEFHVKKELYWPKGKVVPAAPG